MWNTERCCSKVDTFAANTVKFEEAGREREKEKQIQKERAREIEKRGHDVPKNRFIRIKLPRMIQLPKNAIANPFCPVRAPSYIISCQFSLVRHWKMARKACRNRV